MVAAVGRHAHERLGHEAGKEPELAADLAADLAVGGEPVGRVLRGAEREVELELARRVLVVALDHVEAHLAQYSMTRWMTGCSSENWSMW